MFCKLQSVHLYHVYILCFQYCKCFNVFINFVWHINLGFQLYLCVIKSLTAQVRMDALGLVCESHRSTEAVTSQEMDLISPLPAAPNLNSQSPGVRQQTVSLLKKVSHAYAHIASLVLENVLFFNGFPTEFENVKLVTYY